MFKNLIFAFFLFLPTLGSAETFIRCLQYSEALESAERTHRLCISRSPVQGYRFHFAKSSAPETWIMTVDLPIAGMGSLVLPNGEEGAFVTYGRNDLAAAPRIEMVYDTVGGLVNRVVELKVNGERLSVANEI